MHPTDRTLAAYQDGVQAYLDGSGSGPAPALLRFLDQVVGLVPPGGVVLELGSGPGRDALLLEEQGLEVRRTDATPAFVDHLRASGRDASLLDVRYDDLGGPYDAVLAQAVLLHLDRPALALALQACLRATRPGGVLAVTLKEGDGEAWSDAKLDAARWFSYWRAEPLRQALADAGWTVLSLERVQGRLEPWLHVLCRREASG